MMPENYKQDFMLYLETQIQSCRQEESRLIGDCRKDEANFCRIRANVFEIFKTLFTSAQKSAVNKSSQDRDTEIQKNFLNKASRIPENWVASRQKAEEHQDAARLLIENTKLQAAREVTEQFSLIFGRKENS